MFQIDLVVQFEMVSKGPQQRRRSSRRPKLKRVYSPSDVSAVDDVPNRANVAEFECFDDG